MVVDKRENCVKIKSSGEKLWRKKEHIIIRLKQKDTRE